MKKKIIVLLLMILSRFLLADNIDLVYMHRWEEKVRVMIGEDKFSKAESEARKLIKKYPESSLGYSYLGESIRFKDVEQAEKFQKKALELNPDNDYAHANLALIYSYLNQKEKALYHIERAKRYRINDLSSIERIGYALYKIGEIDEAIIFNQETIYKNPNNLMAYYVLGLCCLEKKDLDRSLEIADFLLRRNNKIILFKDFKKRVMEEVKRNENS